MSVRIPFTKMVGTGNDFLIIDTLRHRIGSLTSRWKDISHALCDRRNGAGADGLLLLEPSRSADVKMRIFNSDGSEAQMCGNGARCVALYVQREARGVRRANAPWPLTIETAAGTLSASVRGNLVALRMTDPVDLRLGRSLTINQQQFSYGSVNTGVPHIVIPVRGLDRFDVTRIGRALRSHSVFAPRGTNVNFIELGPRRPQEIRVRTYERGVEAETLACGTGIAASAIVYALSHVETRRTHAGSNGCASPYQIAVVPRSGDRLRVSFTAARRGAQWRVRDMVLEGSAQRVFEGSVSWPMSRTGIPGIP